jgi:hypothetical protein
MSLDFMPGGSPLRRSQNGTAGAPNGTRLARSEP